MAIGWIRSLTLSIETSWPTVAISNLTSNILLCRYV
jgi:hypothetical protein